MSGSLVLRTLPREELRVRFHRPDHGLDVFNLVAGQAVLCIEHFVGPRAIPSLHRYPGVGGMSSVLADLPQRTKEAEEPRLVRTTSTFTPKAFSRSSPRATRSKSFGGMSTTTSTSLSGRASSRAMEPNRIISFTPYFSISLGFSRRRIARVSSRLTVLRSLHTLW